MRVRKLTVVALAVVAGLSLTACQNDDMAVGGNDRQTSAAKDSSEQSNGKDAAANGSDGQGTASGTDSGDNDAASGDCRTDELEITATDSTIGGDEEGTVGVTFKNGGGRECSLSGYAGVDLETSEGTLSAERSGEETTPVVLKDGEEVHFGVQYPLNESGGSGVRITGLVVTPPNETKSVTLDWPGSATLPVTEGGGSSVTVGPLGGIGQGG
ncbi:DUF4232 domain-containing protein [Streptomyces sp. NPDC091377]|uniref:DUF4232 domain-containing protein n=1 Tax=Streptomyces sp. NPDC091377 TaxID=3365995 RepID=UPI0037F9ACE9